jgi:hypothetical protein
MIYFALFFINGMRNGCTVIAIILQVDYQIVPEPFVEKTIFSSLNFPGTLSTKQLTTNM